MARGSLRSTYIPINDKPPEMLNSTRTDVFEDAGCNRTKQEHCPSTVRADKQIYEDILQLTASCIYLSSKGSDLWRGLRNIYSK